VVTSGPQARSSVHDLPVQYGLHTLRRELEALVLRPG
jgi:hypothetical protein